MDQTTILALTETELRAVVLLLYSWHPETVSHAIGEIVTETRGGG